ncbi:P-loop containing nucleoside triphosphate hydrolase protein [Eremomyces bilateralis CBS 781.70]|uniref:ATP-dependent RNA helicase n=1 Tax=Eremomyces bilateralis CBS 781.70 TaxID=1392243 RepID=A0A6G1GF95_9PEZI|nr:P-loop containing nucleoside triphosphate hydrolase protein [Eremomyces bilateralis CBS 781.70]KAF1816785.1 P-loop containing nucleoside triphosphate hydrolase protein [Eremomyces bilateralis CBS 781.70]
MGNRVEKSQQKKKRGAGFGQSKRKTDHTQIEKLEKAINELDPKEDSFKDFADLPISDITKEGIKANHYSVLTDIQAKAIPYGLKGSDILGAAKTGSGKTLAFVIPVLENLYRAQCIGKDAGLGAMIISPTRELAIQIFEVLYRIGRKGHLFAAGLVIGGKHLREEQDALVRMNIVVCTPGRILQHLSQTVNFNVDNLRMLVLDEADRILDMGFQRDVDAIIDYLPKERQTMLFSATQTKRVSDLARLSLQDPEYISVHEAATAATPQSLQQNYVVAPLPEKLDTLWSFLQTAKKSKIIVFLSSGKQVRFVYESFRKMQPGIPLLHLHGRQKQFARHDITSRFAKDKTCCLFATDVVARGIDFPAVDWVVQVDCPEDADTYIHRVGRTARYERNGRAILFLDPTEEEGMVKRLEHKKVPIEKINIKEKKQKSIKDQLQNLCFKDPQLKYLGQKAFSSYVRSIYVQKDKEVFKLGELPLEEFAASLGLPGAPRVKFMEGDDMKSIKNAPRRGMSPSEDDTEEEENDAKDAKGKAKVRTRYDRMFERRNQDILADHYTKLIRPDEEVDESKLAEDFNGEAVQDDSFMTVKRRIAVDEDGIGASSSDEEDAASGGAGLPVKKVVALAGAKEPLLIDSKRREKLLKSKKKLLNFKDHGKKIIFDDDGKPHEVYELEDIDTFKAKGGAEEQRKTFLDAERQRVQLADVEDKAMAKQKRKDKREKQREREREEFEEEANEEEEFGVQLGDRHARHIPVDLGSDESDEEVEAPVKPAKRPKKWFEDSDEEEGGKPSKKRRKQMDNAPETLEDLEALAAGFLGGK